MKFSVLLLLVVLAGCRFNDEVASGPVHTSLAFINDTSLYADGCELYLEEAKDSSSASTVQYKPSVSTSYKVKRTQLEIAAGQPPATKTPVRIAFRETGKQVVIHCGWVSPTVAEIDVLDIGKR